MSNKIEENNNFIARWLLEEEKNKKIRKQRFDFVNKTRYGIIRFVTKGSFVPNILFWYFVNFVISFLPQIWREKKEEEKKNEE